MRSEVKPLRCAIYTRVSTEHGLEQDFNSLQAQREASEAYIKSQAHEGWRLTPNHYDDGGFSGASLDRPALQLLLSDVKAGWIDVVVVYKVDRLTRSLADFAKLVELFDQHSVSFVSVTQAFNTTTSMGRLTLNVLLSFAQFEREVTGERIRDKIAASKQKGMWMGGTVPFGYRVERRKLLIEEREVELVQLIFRRYLELGSLPALQQDLRQAGIVTRARPLSSGKIRGGVPFTTGPLHQLLTNRVYLGEMNHKGRSWPAEHQAIIERSCFDEVQARLAENRNSHHARLTSSEALLIGRIFDDRGNRMTPNHARKGAARYRYYVSLALTKGRKEESGSVTRVPAYDVEQRVIEALRNHVAAQIRAAQLSADDEQLAHWRTRVCGGDQALVAELIERVTIETDRIELRLKQGGLSADEDLERRSSAPGPTTTQFGRSAPLISISWVRPVSRRRREIIMPECTQRSGVRPMRDEVRANLLRRIARARLWQDELVGGKATGIEQIAARERVSSRSVRMALSLAFLSPAIVRALIDGKLPRGIGLAHLSELPASWDEQHRVLGLQSF